MPAADSVTYDCLCEVVPVFENQYGLLVDINGSHFWDGNTTNTEHDCKRRMDILLKVCFDEASNWFSGSEPSFNECVEFIDEYTDLYYKNFTRHSIENRSDFVQRKLLKDGQLDIVITIPKIGIQKKYYCNNDAEANLILASEVHYKNTNPPYLEAIIRLIYASPVYWEYLYTS